MTETFSGMWWLPDQPDVTVAGTVTCEVLKAPKLVLTNPPHGLLPSMTRFATGGADDDVPMLHGAVERYGFMTLTHGTALGTTISRGSTLTLRFRQAVGAVHLSSPDERWLRRVELQLPALEPLLGSRPIDFKTPGRRSRKIILEVPDRRHEWTRDGTTVTWAYVWHIKHGRTTADLRMVPTATLTSTRPRSLDDWMTDWVFPMNQLIEILTGGQSRATSLRVWQKKRPSRFEHTAEAFPTWMSGVGDHDYDFENDRVLVRARAIDWNPDGITAVMERLRRLSAHHEVFLDQVHRLVHDSDALLENRYLDAVTGLEAYDSQVTGEGPTTGDAHRARRTDVLAEMTAAGIDPGTMKFVKRWLARRSSYSLEQRLRRLGRSTSQLASWTVGPDRMAALRNNIAHGNRIGDYDELNMAYQQAWLLARVLVLNELGMTPPEGFGILTARP